MKVKPVRLCDFCGKDISHKRDKGYKKSFCNTECSKKYVAAAKEKYIEIVECKTCNEKFQKRTCDIERTNNNNFCSRSCAAIYNNSETPRRKKKFYLCQTCKKNNLPRKSSLCCTECFKEKSESYRKITLAEVHASLSTSGKHPSWKNSYTRVANRYWNKNLTKIPCQVCGYSIHVELCHIIPMSKFPENTEVGIVNSPENLLVLCRNHHWEFDHGHLTLEQIPKRTEQVTEQNQ